VHKQDTDYWISPLGLSKRSIYWLFLILVIRKPGSSRMYRIKTIKTDLKAFIEGNN